MTEFDRRLTFIFFSTADWSAPYWTNKQHIAQRLAKRGHKVFYIESPGIRAPEANSRDFVRILNRLKKAICGPKKVDRGLWVYSPLTIPFGHGNSLIKKINGYFLRLAISLWLRRQHTEDVVVWTYHPYMKEAVTKLNPKITVYHCVDDLTAIPGVDRVIFGQAEEDLLQVADLVFTTSRYLYEHCSLRAGGKCIYERNVADIEHFSKARQVGTRPTELLPIKGPIIGYTGVLADYKVDFRLIYECAVARPDLSWVFVGEEPERQNSAVVKDVKTLPNVYFLGYRSYDVLPSYLRYFDIAALPNLTTGYMSGVFPMKLYEYIAAGLPVIATNIPSLDDVGGLITTAEGAERWIFEIDRLLREKPASIDLEDKRLSEFSWDKRLDRMLSEVNMVR